MIRPENPEYAASCEQLRIAYPEELPITRHLDEIKQLWQEHPLIIVGGDTGSGKTTQLPKVALELGWGRFGRVGCTQPRRIAASAMARRAAQELGCEPGTAVGYQVRFDDRTSRGTVLKFMTDGILLAETHEDRKLRQYSALIIDEAHERSLNIDFLLGYIKNLLPLRPDLKVAISSATLDTEEFSRFFGNAPVVSIEGRTYPVEDCFLVPEADEELSDSVARGVEFVTELDPRGDILVFLPGEREIRDATDLLNGRKLPNTEVLPLFGRLSAAEQQRVFHPGRQRRIILSTNVAETSVTIPRIRFVIDSGLARIKRFNPRTQIEELQVETISQASARQRRGRCGRVADGICVHLYSEDDLARSAPYTDPEIKRTGLAGVILRMAALELPRITRFPFINPPPAAAVREGMRTLEDLRAIDLEGRLTREGRKLAALPIDPHIGKMLAEAARRRMLAEVIVIASYLSIQDPMERPLEKQQAADEAHRRFRHPDSDFFSILNLWNAMCRDGAGSSKLRRFCRENFLNFIRMREWKNLAADLAEAAADQGWRCGVPAELPENPPYDLIHQSLLAGIPRHIAKYLPEEQRYLGTGGRKFQLFPGSGLFRKKPVPDWIMCFALVETSRLFARQNAVIKPAYLEAAAPHLCSKICDQPYYDAQSGFVYARERLTFGGLLIHAGRRIHYAASHPVEAREIFIRDALANGEPVIPGSWTVRSRAVIDDLLRLEEKARRPGGILDREAVVEHYKLLLPQGIHSVKALKELIKTDHQDYSIARDEVMQEQFRPLDPADYPDTLTFSGQKFRLRYRFAPGEEEDGVTLLAPSDLLNCLPGYALDYLVPGYLPDKIELMLRALPKPVRQALAPLNDAVAWFTGELKAGRLFAEQPLAVLLAESLREQFDVPVAPADFDNLRLPEHLVMKLAELNRDGRVVHIHREVPAVLRSGSRLSRAVAGTAPFASTGCTAFPDLKPLPFEVELPNGNGKKAYPALCDEGESVGSALYLKESEAKLHHRRGILRLFRLENGAQMKFLRRSIRFSRQAELTWFMKYRDYADDLLDSAVLEAFDTAPWELRDATSFGIAAEHARGELGETVDCAVKLLESLLPVYELCRELQRKIAVRSDESAEDYADHLNWLFRNHFLKSPAVLTDYTRYLRGLKLRGERAAAAPARDEAKLETIAEYAERFRLAAADVPEIADSPELYEFWLLFEECRLATFAPEVPLKRRAPLRQLESAWEQLRF